MSIRIVDPDSVLVIDVSLFHRRLKLDKCFGEFGITVNYIIFSLYHIAEKRGSEPALTLLLHVIRFFGVIRISSVFNIGKRTMWEASDLMNYVMSVLDI